MTRTMMYSLKGLCGLYVDYGCQLCFHWCLLTKSIGDAPVMVWC